MLQIIQWKWLHAKTYPKQQWLYLKLIIHHVNNWLNVCRTMLNYKEWHTYLLRIIYTNLYIFLYTGIYIILLVKKITKSLNNKLPILNLTILRIVTNNHPKSTPETPKLASSIYYNQPLIKINKISH